MIAPNYPKYKAFLDNRCGRILAKLKLVKIIALFVYFTIDHTYQPTPRTQHIGTWLVGVVAYMWRASPQIHTQILIIELIICRQVIIPTVYQLTEIYIM